MIISIHLSIYSDTPSHLWEQLFIEISNPTNNQGTKIIIGSIYRPPPNNSRSNNDIFYRESPIGEHESHKLSRDNGVPQGSIVGPLIFISMILFSLVVVSNVLCTLMILP